MPRDDRPRRRPRDDEDDDRPRKRPAKKAADPEKLYLLIGGGVAALVLLVAVVYFAARPSRKADDAAGGANAAAAGGPFAAKAPEAQDATSVTLSNFQRTAAGGTGKDARGTVRVDYTFAAYPADRGKYYLVFEMRKETKEVDLGVLKEREGMFESDVTGPLAREAVKVWMAYKADGQTGPGKVVSNTLSAVPPATGDGEESKP